MSETEDTWSTLVMTLEEVEHAGLRKKTAVIIVPDEFLSKKKIIRGVFVANGGVIDFAVREIKDLGTWQSG